MTANNPESSAIAFTKEMAQSILQCDREFPVDLDDAWQWLGYSTKQKALQFLKNNFEDGEDFLTQRLKTSTGGRPSDSIVLTIECLKSFGMMTGTSQGKQIRKYFIQCEKVAKAMSLPKKEPNLCATETGLLKLGKLIRAQRESLGLYLEDVTTKIIKETGYKWSLSSLSKFEVGKMYFDPNFAAVILAVLPIPHPTEDRPFTEFEIWEIARENIDPSTGIYTASQLGQSLPMAQLTTPIIRSHDKDALIGKRFTRLEVLSRDRYTQKYECRCDCGNIKKISRAHLVNGSTQSCGCLRDEVASLRKSVRYPELISIIGELRSEGMTYSAIAQYLNDKKEPTLSGKGIWSISKVQQIVAKKAFGFQS